MRAEICEIVATEHIDSAWHLLEEHRDELTTNKDLMQLAPRRDKYKALEAVGALISLGAFIGDELVGYSINILSRNLHYSGLQICQNDLFFVSAKHRGMLGLRLMRATKDAARAKAAALDTVAVSTPVMMLWHAKPDTPFAALLPKLGCKVQDIVFSEVL